VQRISALVTQLFEKSLKVERLALSKEIMYEDFSVTQPPSTHVGDEQTARSSSVKKPNTLNSVYNHKLNHQWF